MAAQKETGLAERRWPRDPLALFRQMTREFDRAFEEPFGAFRWPSLRQFSVPEAVAWAPEIDIFERDNRLVTKIDLPGLKKEDVKVEVTDGYLAISGERKSESEEKEENVYRRERSYGSFCRAVPLPEGAKIEDVKAAFADGVLEVSVPLATKQAPKPRTVPIEEGQPVGKIAAA